MYLKKKEHILYISLLVLTWILAVVYVDPVGNFPLDDDWAYARPVKSFLEKGKLEFTDWPAMTLIGHLTWGLLFTKAFGFSFTVLRMSVLVLGLLGLVSLFHLLTFLRLPSRIAFAVALLIGCNPIYFCLSNSYMTDVPFFAWSVLAILFFLREISSEEHTSDYIGAIVCSLLATSIRQPGIIYPFAFGCIVCSRRKDFKTVVYGLSPFVIVLGSLLFYELFYRYQIGYGANFPNKNLDFFKTLFGHPFYVVERQSAIVLKIMLYIGLFLFPLSGVLLSRLKILHTRPKLFFSVSILASVAVLVQTELIHKVMPFDGGNILTNLGTGPALLFDHDSLKIPVPFAIPGFYWKIVTVLSFFSFCVLFMTLFEHVAPFFRQPLHLPPPFLYALICLLLYIPMTTLLSFYDRYTLPVLLFILILIFSWPLPSISSRGGFFFAFSLSLVAFFSLNATSTYLNWNRARWKAMDYLTKTLAVPTTQIDGGFEANGWYNYCTLDKRPQGEDGKKSWWWVYDNSYVISFSPLPDHQLLKQFPYRDDVTHCGYFLYVCKKR